MPSRSESWTFSSLIIRCRTVTFADLASCHADLREKFSLGRTVSSQAFRLISFRKLVPGDAERGLNVDRVLAGKAKFFALAVEENGDLDCSLAGVDGCAVEFVEDSFVLGSSGVLVEGGAERA